MEYVLGRLLASASNTNPRNLTEDLSVSLDTLLSHVWLRGEYSTLWKLYTSLLSLSLSLIFVRDNCMEV
jgi:hypothetical protein